MTDQTPLQWCERVLAEARKAMEAKTQGDWTAELDEYSPGACVMAHSGGTTLADVYGDEQSSECLPAMSNARFIVLAAAAFPEWLRCMKSDVETARMTYRKGDARFVGLVVKKLAPVAVALGIDLPEAKP